MPKEKQERVATQVERQEDFTVIQSYSYAVSKGMNKVMIVLVLVDYHHLLLS